MTLPLLANLLARLKHTPSFFSNTIQFARILFWSSATASPGMRIIKT
ncbi:hypothetical protein [Neisseria shayeganii]|uniref:Uncharacterized protein n=1 Tax=Neisseria shayeganii TaxID=607712 RepID=A0A7D7S7A3_9NEIS|nr:hypothetical protein [Neisseria shayeganii]QMT39791.1 hypothetical protein H3L94_07895 [Neisseria shayeganii]